MNAVPPLTRVVMVEIVQTRTALLVVHAHRGGPDHCVKMVTNFDDKSLTTLDLRCF